MTDRKFRMPRLWSNRQLRRFAPLFRGSVINVSGALDEDKEGAHYRDYFTNAASYAVSNWSTELRGYQNRSGEILLDLEAPLPDELTGRYDVVFNHTTLEHVFDMFTAFRNLCRLSNDVVIIVVPFAQEHHPADFGDYWRFSPQAVKRLYEHNGYTLLYLSGLNEWNVSSYVFAIGTCNPARWQGSFPEYSEPVRLGEAMVRNGLVRRLAGRIAALRR